MLRQDAQSAESRFACIVQLTKTITNVPFAYAYTLESMTLSAMCNQLAQTIDPENRP